MTAVRGAIPTSRHLVFAVAAVCLLAEPASAFCVRNDTGAPISVRAEEGTAAFDVDIANNEKTCCSPKDQGCAIGENDVQLSISTPEGGSCALTVDPKGNINVTGKPDALKCKANKAGSTMDWASG